MFKYCRLMRHCCYLIGILAVFFHCIELVFKVRVAIQFDDIVMFSCTNHFNCIILKAGLIRQKNS